MIDLADVLGGFSWGCPRIFSLQVLRDFSADALVDGSPVLVRRRAPDFDFTKGSFLLAFLMLPGLQACSTSPPSGNQVDGLPLVAHFCDQGMVFLDFLRIPLQGIGESGCTPRYYIYLGTCKGGLLGEPCARRS